MYWTTTPLRVASTIVFLALLAGCGDNQPDPTVSKKLIRSHKARIAQIERHRIPIVHSVPGTVVPAERLQIASRVTGYIEKINVDEGDIVEPGEILVEIDNARVEASIKSADAEVTYLQAELEEAQGDVKRFRKLIQSKTITEDQLRKAIVKLAGAKTKLAKAKAELKSNQQERQYTHLSSPVRAQVRERLQDPGDLAGANPILRLDVLGAMELEVYLPSTRIGNVVIGQKVDVYIQSESTPLAGKVKRIVRAADKVTRRSKVRIALPDNQSLAPGQFGRAQIVLREELLKVIPLEAITERAGIKGVFILDDSNTVHFRSIRAGRKFKLVAEMLAGPEVGTQVVLSPSALIHDGDHITSLPNREN